MAEAANGALSAFSRAYGTTDPFKAMRRSCRHARQRAGEQRAPVGLAAIARHIGASIRYERLAIDGALSVSGGRYLITVSTAAHWRRARFSLAHEIAHILLLEGVPAGSGGELADPELHPIVERLCDFGASELLMPGELLRPELQSAGFAAAGLRELYDRFLVSWPALFSGIARACRPANVSIWGPHRGAREGPQMRVVHSFGSKHDLWVPRGLGEHYLSKLLISTAASHGTAASAGLELRYWPHARALGLASRLPAYRPQQELLPLWNGRPVPDELTRRGAVALLLLSPAAGELFVTLQRGPRVVGAPAPGRGEDSPPALAA